MDFLKFIELIEQRLESYEESSHDHTPNALTKKALGNTKSKKGLKKANTVEELFEKLAK